MHDIRIKQKSFEINHQVKYLASKQGKLLNKVKKQVVTMNILIFTGKIKVPEEIKNMFSNHEMTKYILHQLEGIVKQSKGF